MGDFGFTGSDHQESEPIKELLERRYTPLRDLHGMTFFIGLEIDRDRPNKQMTVSQRKYTLELLEKFGFENCRTNSTPMQPHTKLLHDAKNDSDFHGPYREAVGGLIHLMVHTRPDIAFSVSQVSQFMHSPKRFHWNAVCNISRYLSGTIDHGIKFSGGKDLRAFTDSDWAGCVDLESLMVAMCCILVINLCHGVPKSNQLLQSPAWSLSLMLLL